MRVVAEPIPCPVILAQPKTGEAVLIFRVGLLPAGVVALLNKLLAHL
ncbi:MAG: hypothetical protein ACXVGE_13140 [Blastococcus sp.]